MTRRRTTEPKQDNTMATTATADGHPVDEDAVVPGVPEDHAEDPAAPPGPTVDGRPQCHVPQCPLPEFVDGAGLCGGHWATRPDLRKAARREA